MKNNNLTDEEVMAIFMDSEKMTRILQSDVNAALVMHKRAGNPVCGYLNGKVVWVEAKDIPKR